MSSKPAVIRAEFTDYRPVKTWRVLQLVFEVPAEQQAEIFEVLGYPIMGSSTWCGIARLVAGAGAPVPEKPVEPAPVERSKAKRSGLAFLICQNPEFVAWFTRLCERHLPTYRHGMTADEMLKARLGIQSKSELDTNSQAAAEFDAIRTDYELREFAR